MQAEKGRGQRHRLKLGDGTFTLIDESYNANPTSMEAALDLLASAPLEDGGRRIAVLGDMLELGNHSRDLHMKLAGPIKSAGIDRLYLAGAEIKVLADAVSDDMECEYEETADGLTDKLIAAPASRRRVHGQVVERDRVFAHRESVSGQISARRRVTGNSA